MRRSTLGLLVDDAIITTEMMVVKMEQGWDRACAAKVSMIALAPLAGEMRTTSLGRRHLRRLFCDLCRVDNEFERVRILVLLYQLEVHKPFRIS
jgi:hypothetical protein